MYLQGVLPWESSKWIAPPPEEIARIRKEAGTEIALPTANGEDAIAPHVSRSADERAAAAEAARLEKERELERSSGEESHPDQQRTA